MFVCLPEFAFRLCVIMHLVGLSVGFCGCFLVVMGFLVMMVACATDYGCCCLVA